MWSRTSWATRNNVSCDPASSCSSSGNVATHSTPASRHCSSKWLRSATAVFVQQSSLAAVLVAVTEVQKKAQAAANRLEVHCGGDGPESVNQALYEAVHQTAWSQEPNVYRAEFLVGEAEDHELAWYDPGEVAFLVEFG